MRTEWAKSSARALRYKEEVAIVCQEMYRVMATFTHRASTWLKKAESISETDPFIREGVEAFARDQAGMYTSLREKFSDQWADAVKHIK